MPCLAVPNWPAPASTPQRLIQTGKPYAAPYSSAKVSEASFVEPYRERGGTCFTKDAKSGTAPGVVVDVPRFGAERSACRSVPALQPWRSRNTGRIGFPHKKELAFRRILKLGFQSSRPDAIVHAAAQPSYDLSAPAPRVALTLALNYI